eukprot:3883627-Prorocentrum_lima.AAC.1
MIVPSLNPSSVPSLRVLSEIPSFAHGANPVVLLVTAHSRKNDCRCGRIHLGVMCAVSSDASIHDVNTQV